MRVVWATDTHLNAAASDTIAEFIISIQNEKPDALYLSGDISDGDSTRAFVKFLHNKLQCKIYFVLGNHDYFHNFIGEAQQWCANLSRKNKDIVYLPNAGVVKLSDDTALVGVDGWGDCKVGTIELTKSFLDDKMILDFVGLRRSEITKLRQELAEQNAQELRDCFTSAVKTYKNIQILTHVPPFREASTHKGKPSDELWAPFMVCKSTGDALLEAANANPNTFFTVNCGHSHGESVYKPLPNLTVFTASATVRRPRIAGVFEV